MGRESGTVFKAGDYQGATCSLNGHAAVPYVHGQSLKLSCYSALEKGHQQPLKEALNLGIQMEKSVVLTAMGSM